MKKTFRKTALLLGAFTLVGGMYPQAVAAAGPELGVQEVQQQQKKVTGTVSDAMGPIIGASVMEKGTSNGAVTDFDGNFTLNVKPGATLVISYIGYEKQEVRVGSQNVLNITLREDANSLEEVVVVGYGVQKKKLVTGATVQVKGEDLAKLHTTNALQAMQSQSPGVQIVQTSGQAGSGFKVNIRGIGTIGDSAPLYVIDGVAGGDINSLNPGDIESIDVLKDAASAAIYGARAANGVILVTTKQGKAGSMELSYDGYVGWQYLYKKPDVLNAREFMYAQDLIAFNDGQDFKNWQAMLPAATYADIMNGTWTGTNWIDESYHKGAMVQNHSIGLNGGTELSTYSLGFAYTDQDGIFGGKNQSEYQRYNARINSDHVLLKGSDFDIIKIGENFTFSHTTSGGVDTGNMYWNNMHDLLIGNPLIPAYTADGSYFTNEAINAAGYNLGVLPVNPLANADVKGLGLHANKSWNMFLSANVQIQPIKDLIFKSQFGYRYWSGSYRSMTRIHATGTDIATQDGASQSLNLGSQISWENTLAYTKQFGLHNINVVIGNTIQKNTYGESLNASGKNNLFEEDWDRAWIGNTQNTQLADISLGGGPQGDWSLASFFGRASYNYNEKYMAQFTLRADGSSNFAPGHRWGYFPSASVGWVITNEKFMESASSWLDFLKLRASWGQNGNQSIANFQYLMTFGFSAASGYFYGVGNHTSPTTGGYANVLQNPDVTWETSEQLDLGIDARFLGGRLGLAFDWYKKTTKDWLLAAPILSVYGLNAPYVNGGDVENKGFEVGLNWNDHIGDFTYGVNFNLAYNKNEVTKINNGEGIIHGPGSVLIQGSDEVFRAKVGEPIGYFYGMKTAGVFQNQAQVDAWKAKYVDNIHGGNPQPGDLIYVDTDGNNIIDLEDRTNIGDPHPDFTAGLGLNMGYKGFDFSVTATGAFGQQILRSTNNDSNMADNLSQKLVYGSWRGEGTSNFLPKLNNLKNINFMTMSDIWLEDADYVKIQNVTLGYDFANVWKTSPFSQLRLYFAANNLFTFTGYSGMDPEMGASGGNDDSYGWAAGIDNGFYPTPRTYMVGVNVKFKGSSAKKAETKTVYVTDNAELDRLNGEVNRLRAENDALKARKPEKEIIDNSRIVTFPYLVNFTVNTTDVVNREKVNLETVAAMIKATPEKKYSVIGYADKQTGTPEGNAKLASGRAQNVYDILINQYGVPASQLVKDSKGGVDYMYMNDEQLSRSVIISEVK
ncbi:MAG: SusC/RagA family TonB-linked outer membrane protein [Prevotella sp.]|nr:SusC/RagA family TonB-linked outer membrane protein [Prevotella sp.]